MAAELGIEANAMEQVLDRYLRAHLAEMAEVGDVRAPDLIWLVDLQPAQQIGVGLVPFRGLAGIGFLIDRHGGGSENSPGDCFPDEGA